MDPIGDQAYIEDINGEERKADKVIEFQADALDEKKIKEWWESYKISAKYNLMTNNCSTVVYRALLEGGAGTFLEARKTPKVWYPKAVEEYAIALLRSTRAENKKVKGERITVEIFEATQEFLAAVDEAVALGTF